MATTSNKRTLGSTDITGEKPSKKRKLNETSPSISASINPSASVSLPADADILKTSSEDTKLSPTNNPEVRDVNIEAHDNDKNAHTAKCDKNNHKTCNDKDTDHGKAKENGNTGDPNANASNWSFSASSFTFGNNSWVKQTSNASELSNEDEVSGKHKLANDSTTDSFSQFEGLGFKQVLANERSKEAECKTEAAANTEATAKDTATKQEASESDSKKDDEKATDASSWGAGWSNSNPDGTFKLNFDWGSWDNVNTKIDLNPSTKVGWESQATAYDPNAIEEDDSTKEVLKQMAGEQDTGDKQDEVKCSAHCKVYNLEKGKYVERGKGVVKVNTYSVDGEDDKIRGRILCRRDTVLTTIINAPILKEMKFEKVGGFIRFCVVEVVEENAKEKKSEDSTTAKTENSDNRQEAEKEDKEQTKKETETETEKEEAEDGAKKEQDKEENEDSDLNTEIKTYLIKPINKSDLDTFLNKIKDIQKLVSQ